MFSPCRQAAAGSTAPCSHAPHRTPPHPGWHPWPCCKPGTGTLWHPHTLILESGPSESLAAPTLAVCGMACLCQRPMMGLILTLAPASGSGSVHALCRHKVLQIKPTASVDAELAGGGCCSKRAAVLTTVAVTAVIAYIVTHIRTHTQHMRRPTAKARGYTALGTHPSAPTGPPIMGGSAALPPAPTRPTSLSLSHTAGTQPACPQSVSNYLNTAHTPDCKPPIRSALGLARAGMVVDAHG
jgi:hypothetical protein